MYELLQKEAVKFDGHGTACIGLCWSPNGQHLASISTDNFLFFWDVDNKAETRIGSKLLSRSDFIFASTGRE